MAGMDELRGYVLRNVGLVMPSLFVNQAVITVAGALLAHWVVDPRTFGELSIAIQFLSLAGLLIGVGLPPALVYDLATGRRDAATAYGIALRGTLLGAVVLTALLWIAAPMLGRLYASPDLPLAIGLGALGLLASALLNVTSAAFTGLRRFALQVGMMILATTFTWGLRLALIPFVHGPSAVAWIMLGGSIGSAVGAVASMWWVRRLGLRPAPRRHGVDRDEAGHMLRYGVPIWLANALKTFQGAFLTMVVGTLSVAEAGAMSNAVVLTGVPTLVTWAFRSIAVPFIAAGPDKAARRERGLLCFRLNHFALYPVTAAFLLYPGFLMAAVFGPTYASAAAYLPLLALGVYGSAIARLGSDVLAADGFSRGSLEVMLLSAATVTVGAPLLASHGGVAESAVFLAGWVLSAAHTLWLLSHRGLGLSGWWVFGEPLLPTLAATPFALASLRLGGLSAWGAGLMACCVLAGLTWWLGGKRAPAARIDRALSA
jgi:O-antigen/teichoic acid export membrane protein